MDTANSPGSRQSAGFRPTSSASRSTLLRRHAGNKAPDSSFRFLAQLPQLGLDSGLVKALPGQISPVAQTNGVGDCVVVESEVLDELAMCAQDHQYPQ
ncbi:MAG: hypothetical protein V9G23_20125 [Giesbergeria sp.]